MQLKPATARLLALCIIAGAFVPFFTSKTPSTPLLALYGALIAVYLLLTRIIRCSWKHAIFLITLIVIGIIMWNIADVLPPVVYVFFIAFLVTLLSMLYLVATLRE